MNEVESLICFALIVGADVRGFSVFCWFLCWPLAAAKGPEKCVFELFSTIGHFSGYFSAQSTVSYYQRVDEQ